MDRHSAINRLYRLVWNESLMIWTAVAEIARGRGKSGTGRRRLATLLALSASIPLVPPAMAGPITPDGRTQTTLSSSGNVTDIRTGTVSGSNAFNSFSTFTVNGGQVVNMHLGGASNLVNLVTDGRTTINGMLNAIKNNAIGGNVFFASPKGFVVGSSGVLNVGSLTVSTPAQSFVTDFFLESGEVDPASVGALLSGSLSNGAGSSISVDGTINAMGNVRLLSGSVRIGGTIFRGARFVGLAPDFSDVVNANGLEDGTKIVEENGRIKVVADTGAAAETVAGEDAGTEPGAGSGTDGTGTGTTTSEPVVAGTNPAPAPDSAPTSTMGGTGTGTGTETVTTAPDAGTRVEIVADTDVTVSGVIRNDGSEGVSGGQIDIRAGQNLTLEAGTLITASGQGANSGGGTVYLFANNNAVTHTGAAVNASAGSTGDGGAIEFSAKNSVDLAGGQFAAGATGGQRGTVLIDPTDVVVSANQILNGADYQIVGGTFTVNEGIVVSTRTVGAGHQLTGASTGDSGNVTIQVGNVDLKANSMLLAHADGGHTGGNVTINAHRVDGGAAAIQATGATITGATVTLDAQSAYTDPALPLPVTVPSAQASINLTDTTVKADGQLILSAQSSVDTSTATQSPVGTTVVDSAASVEVGGTSQLTATGDATLSATSTVKAKVEPQGDTTAVLPVDASVAVNVIESTSTVRLGDSASVIRPR